jgi:DNA repair protein RadC
MSAQLPLPKLLDALLAPRRMHARDLEVGDSTRSIATPVGATPLAARRARGKPSASDVELVARVADVTRGRAVKLLDHVGGLAGLARGGLPELRAGGASGTAATALLDALELGWRATGGRPAPGRRLPGPAEVSAYMRARLAATPVEEFWAIALNVRHVVMFETCIARGSLTGVDVHPRDVFRPLIRAGAAAVLLCHNHPSGEPDPSRQDIELTTRLREVGELCGISVFDHVVVGANGYVSLAQRHWR